jgi:hypothetical protein
MHVHASSRRWLATATLFAVFRLIAFLPAEVNTFAGSHYLFSYAAGFQKRALVGAALGAYFTYLSSTAIYATSLCVLAAFVATLLVFTRTALLMSGESLALGLVLLGAPAVLPHFAYSIGYFDPILVICALLTLAILDASLPAALKVALACGVCAVGVLTHEMYLFAAFPLILARAFLVQRPDKRLLWILTGLVCVTTALVVHYGQPSLPLDRYMSLAEPRTDVKLDREAFQLLYFHSWLNLLYLAQHYSSVFTDARLVAALIVPIPYFLMLYDLFVVTTRARGMSARQSWAVGVWVLAPLLLTLVGFDVLRWISFACLNCSLLILESIRLDSSGEVREALQRQVHSARFWVLALLSFALAPLHVVDGNGIATGIHSIAHGLGLVRW